MKQNISKQFLIDHCDLKERLLTLLNKIKTRFYEKLFIAKRNWKRTFENFTVQQASYLSSTL